MSARILIVEDDPVSLELFTCLLKLAGHQAIRTSDGEAGLRAARYERPNLVVCDVSLPGIDGLEVARQLKLDATRAPFRWWRLQRTPWGATETACWRQVSMATSRSRSIPGRLLSRSNGSCLEKSRMFLSESTHK